MFLIPHKPKQAISKAYLRHRPLRSDIDNFKSNLNDLLSKLDDLEKESIKESEEHLKNNIRDFMLDSFYRSSNLINTKARIDLAIYLGTSTNDKVGVIFETKSPRNTNEMISTDTPNSKALCELILYYFDERETHKNPELKHLIVTNVYEWYIFDANDFDRHIYNNTKLKNLFKTCRSENKDTNFFYIEAAKILKDIEEGLHCTYFDIREYLQTTAESEESENSKLISLYKVLSPTHLLKIPISEDSNKLNPVFYRELLHIIGLEEVKENNKLIIRRKKVNRNPGSLIENAINIIETEDVLRRVPELEQYGNTKEEQLFAVALELSITWINRILFLKLLEAQLVKYHKGDRKYRFLNTETLKDYDELYKLFHQVLAKTLDARTEAIKQKFSHIPYLNSSLFEISEMEDYTIKMNSLDDSLSLELISGSVLKDNSFVRNNKLPSLDYLFRFLDAYDFASEGSGDMQDEAKTIINASVLGKVFEKINGYKDGSIFTPGFITMYMCRESIRLAVIQKFKDKYNWNIEKFEDIRNYLADYRTSRALLEQNELINSLKICDPAVGSGHFLVSALNEIIAIKYELGILVDEQGRRLSEIEISIENDELLITNQHGEIIEYEVENGKPLGKEIQRIQKTLFNEKQTIIENCLFGVDINPNSVKICRLRLWIELLKNAYYKEETNYTELETLPNIDINIKCGNSLISRFPLDSDLSKALKSIKYNIHQYRDFVREYKNEKNREVKRGLQKIIDYIKNDFRTEIASNDPKVLKLSKATGELHSHLTQHGFFELDKKQIKNYEETKKKLETEITKLSAEIEEIKSNAIYRNAFEWRFEFPEVLDDDGNFLGFDLVIGNPPYIQLRDIADDYQSKLTESQLYEVAKGGRLNMFQFFIPQSILICKMNFFVCLITQNSILGEETATNCRKYIFNNCQLVEFSSFPERDNTQKRVFENVKMSVCITLLKKLVLEDFNFHLKIWSERQMQNVNDTILTKSDILNLFSSNYQIPLVNNLTIDILKKIKKFQPSFQLQSFAGEIDMTKYKGYFKSKGDLRVLHGAQVQKYYISDSPTQGKINYLNIKDIKNNIRAKDMINSKRIVMQRITGVDSKIRLIMTIPLFNHLCSNSTNYILDEKNHNLEYILGVLNSKLINFFLKLTSTNTNITAKEINSLPIPITKYDNLIKQKVVVLLNLNDNNQGTKKRVIEDYIDLLVYKIYNLIYDYVKIIDNEFENVLKQFGLTPEDYERMSIEELTEIILEE